MSWQTFKYVDMLVAMIPFGRLFQLLNFEAIKIILILSGKGPQQICESYDIILVLANLKCQDTY